MRGDTTTCIMLIDHQLEPLGKISAGSILLEHSIEFLFDKASQIGKLSQHIFEQSDRTN